MVGVRPYLKHHSESLLGREAEQLSDFHRKLRGMDLLGNRERRRVEALGQDGADQNAVQFLQGHGENRPKTFAIDIQLAQAVELVGNLDAPTNSNEFARIGKELHSTGHRP
jgi:hypothetical protein